MKIQSAFTFIEMLVVLTIIAILAMGSVAQLKNMHDVTQDNLVRDKLILLLQSANHEAETRHVTISLCASNDYVSCVKEASADRILFVDDNEDGIVHAKEKVIAIEQLDLHGGALYWRTYPYYRTAVQFTPEECDNATFWYCRCGAERPTWAVQLNKFGGTHVLVARADGAIRDAHGEELVCNVS